MSVRNCAKTRDERVWWRSAPLKDLEHFPYQSAYRVDCPGGLEERSCNGSCLYPMQFKCKDSAICVAMENICDEVIDCPFQDDEYFCDSLNTTCPQKCICLLFVILHVNTKIYDFQFIILIFSHLAIFFNFVFNFHQQLRLLLFINPTEQSGLKTWF